MWITEIPKSDGKDKFIRVKIEVQPLHPWAGEEATDLVERKHETLQLRTEPPQGVRQEILPAQVAEETDPDDA